VLGLALHREHAFDASRESLAFNHEISCPPAVGSPLTPAAALGCRRSHPIPASSCRPGSVLLQLHILFGCWLHLGCCDCVHHQGLSLETPAGCFFATAPSLLRLPWAGRLPHAVACLVRRSAASLHATLRVCLPLFFCCRRQGPAAQPPATQRENNFRSEALAPGGPPPRALRYFVAARQVGVERLSIRICTLQGAGRCEWGR
jgi:hypothetical protein